MGKLAAIGEPPSFPAPPPPQLAWPDPSSCLIQNETPFASLKGW